MKTKKKDKAITLYDNFHFSKYKYAKHSAQKMRLVIDQIRGMPVLEAKKVLKFSDKRAAVMINKCLDAAIANAALGCVNEKKNINKPAITDPRELEVSHCWVDEAPTRKGWIPRSKGMANPLLFRSSHITVMLGQKEDK
jgi:large subunit ribosomal protein L22